MIFITPYLAVQHSHNLLALMYFKRNTIWPDFESFKYQGPPQMSWTFDYICEDVFKV